MYFTGTLGMKRKQNLLEVSSKKLKPENIFQNIQMTEYVCLGEKINGMY